MTSDIILTLLFLAGVLAVYYLVPRGRRVWVLLAASVIFYVSAGFWMLKWIVGSGLWTFYAGVKMEQAETKEKKKVWLRAGILAVLGFLFAEKYLGFLWKNLLLLSSVLRFPLAADFPFSMKALAPLGISYYSFKMISYLADIYQEKRHAERGVEGCGIYLAYVLFFPQILCGPIERSEHFTGQLHEGPVYRSELFSLGLQWIVLGLFKKMVIANRLAGYVDAVFGAPESYPGLACVMAAFFYSFQLYCDFSGYSDIAVGMANVLGLDSRKNFDCPYFSRGIKEFWARWHISLSGWLRDYIYIPLGGNRVSKTRHRLNVLATFLISGLWHGADWSFVLWGGIHGVWNLVSTKKEEAVSLGRRIWQTLITFCGVTLAWVFFRADSLGQAVSFLRHAITGFSLSYAEIQNSILPFTGDNTCAAYFLTACGFLFLLFLYEREQVYGKKRDRDVILGSGWLAVMTVSVVLFGVFGASGFLYANF